MIAPSGEQIEIAVGDQQAVVVEVGGGLRSYSAGGRELVDGYRADEMSSSGRGQVLIPWPPVCWWRQSPPPDGGSGRSTNPATDPVGRPPNEIRSRRSGPRRTP